ncbi:hypothetical protein [uncultured Prevotella sp.]|uniref:hypothetical protein n=1 Tax=uncultured Prevotella sp. TaxID=159272 RepID=UPI002675CFB9|nr:hypothetical protein [uncultured Prevotella sp.]
MRKTDRRGTSCEHQKQDSEHEKAATETAGNAAKRHRHTTAAGITAQKAANGDAKAILSDANMPHIAAQKTAFAKRSKSRGKTAEISAPACGINLRRRAHCHHYAA